MEVKDSIEKVCTIELESGKLKILTTSNVNLNIENQYLKMNAKINM